MPSLAVNASTAMRYSSPKIDKNAGSGSVGCQKGQVTPEPRMIIDKIEPIALRIGTLSLVLCRVTTRSGLTGYGECLCNRPPMQQALVATIRDAIAPLYVGQSVDDKETLNLAARRRFASFGRA